MYISPIDDPQDTLAAHLPDGYPWDHDAPPSTEPSPAMHPALDVDYGGDEEPLRPVDDGEDDETERRNADAADRADADHDDAWWL